MSTATAQPFQSNHALGIALALAGGATLSIGGPIVRMFEDAGGWTIMFYRGLSFFAMMFAIVCWRSRGRVIERYRSINATGVAIAVCLGVGLVSYLFAMLNTTVANVVFVTGAAPVATSLLAWVVLRERVSAPAMTLMLVAVLGVALMVVEGISVGRMTGNLIALVTLGTYAVFVILLRLARDFDMLAGTSLAGLVASAIAFFMADTLAISTHDLILAFIFGGIQIGLGFTFITYASRHIPAAQVTLLALSETILAPVWAWAVVGEIPSPWTLIGGAVVLVCVALFALHALRDRRPGENPA